MKVKNVFGLFYLICSLAYGEEWLGCEIWNPKCGTDPESFAVIYQGRQFSPTIEITAADSIDQSSPEASLRSLFLAYNRQDVGLLNQIYAPGEQLHSYRPSANNKVTKMEFRQELDYGTYKLLFIKISTDTVTFPAILFVRELEKKYFFTDLPNTNSAILLLNSFYSGWPRWGIPDEKQLEKIDFTDRGYIYLTNTYGAGAPLVFRFHGENYDTNAVIWKWPVKEDQNLSSPTGTLAAAIAALNSGDVERYVGLLNPAERSSIINYGFPQQNGKTWEAWLREEFPPSEKKMVLPEAIRLNRTIEYGEDSVLFFEDNNVNLGRGWLCFRKNGANWYISDQLNSGGSQLINYLGYPLSLKTKMFPSFK